MASKIPGIDTRSSPLGPGRAVERVKDAAAERQNSAVADSGASVDVEITGTAKQLAQLEHALANQPAVDDARVNSIRNDIEQGRYQVKPGHVADQFLQLERALGRLER